MHIYLKLTQCSRRLRMFSYEWCGRTEIIWNTVIFGSNTYIVIWIDAPWPSNIISNLRHCFFTQTPLTVSSSPHTVPTRHLAMSQPPPATQHVVRWEIVSQRASCWGRYWHGLIQNWHGHDWPLHVTTKLRTPKANYTMQFVCVHIQYSIHPIWTRSNRHPR